MIIIADKAGLNAIEQLVDVALKYGGKQNLPACNIILATVQDYDKVFGGAESGKTDDPTKTIDENTEETDKTETNKNK